MMRSLQIKPILLFVSLTVFVLSCKDDTLPADTLRTGDQNSVFSFFSFDQPEIPLTSETNNNGWNAKNYSSLLDLNEDGSFDINLFYNQLVSITGNEIYFSAISQFNNSFEIVGRIETIEDTERWVPILFESGQSIKIGDYNLGIDTSETYLSYFAKEDVQINTNFNAFPVPESDAYLIFQMRALNNRQIIGWFHIEQLASAKGIRILDVGYNFLN